MVTSSLPLLLAAAIVGILHMSAPDHWVTLIVLGRVSNWSRSRMMVIGAMTGFGHVLISVVLGFAIVIVGLFLSQQISGYIIEGTGLAMIVGGLYYGFMELRSAKIKGHVKGTKDGLPKGEVNFTRRFSYFAVLGAALSPDLSILPIFLISVRLGLGFAFDTAAVFAAASILALLLFLIIGMAGLARAFERIPPEYNDALVGFVVTAVGVYILVAG